MNPLIQYFNPTTLHIFCVLLFLYLDFKSCKILAFAFQMVCVLSINKNHGGGKTPSAQCHQCGVLAWFHWSTRPSVMFVNHGFALDLRYWRSTPSFLIKPERLLLERKFQATPATPPNFLLHPIFTVRYSYNYIHILTLQRLKRCGQFQNKAF